jgi:hypothetical protein
MDVDAANLLGGLKVTFCLVPLEALIMFQGIALPGHSSKDDEIAHYCIIRPALSYLVGVKQQHSRLLPLQ